MANNNSDQVPFEVFAWSRRVFSLLLFLVVIFALTSVGLGVYSITLYAKKEKQPEPIIYEVDKAANMIVRIQRGNLEQDRQALLRSVSMRSYVVDRETINHLDEKERWKKVRLMSSETVWKRFASQMNPEENANSPLKNDKFSRKVEVVFDYPIDKETYRVEYNVIDSFNGVDKPARRYVAIIRYDLSDSFVRYDDRFLNLDGIQVTRFDVRKG